MKEEFKTIPSLSVSSWEELMTVGQLSFVFWWPSPSLTKRRQSRWNKTLHTFIYSHTTGHDSGLYLSMLSSQVSPTRSSSESDCRWTKQTLLVMAAHESFSSCCSVCYLIRVDYIGTAVTGISHPIVVSVFLVWVGDSWAVVKDILQAWDHKHLSALISASCVKALTGK